MLVLDSTNPKTAEVLYKCWAARELGAEIGVPVFMTEIAQTLNIPIEAIKAGDTFTLDEQNLQTLILMDLDSRTVLPN